MQFSSTAVTALWLNSPPPPGDKSQTLSLDVTSKTTKYAAYLSKDPRLFKHFKTNEHSQISYHNISMQEHNALRFIFFQKKIFLMESLVISGRGISSWYPQSSCTHLRISIWRQFAVSWIGTCEQKYHLSGGGTYPRLVQLVRFDGPAGGCWVTAVTVFWLNSPSKSDSVTRCH